MFSKILKRGAKNLERTSYSEKTLKNLIYGKL
jgi:hypothetical protein